jgi:histidinol-phosphatase (PHP family)
MVLPADTHVHSEFSWDSGSDPDAPGRMERTCARAVRIGLSTLVFTEHLDLDGHWRADPQEFAKNKRPLLGADGYVHLPPFDLDGYLDEIDRCRSAFPELHIMTGVEFGQPHLWEKAAAPLFARAGFDRINGSLHTLAWPDRASQDHVGPDSLNRTHAPADVMWAYLEEIPHMVAGSDCFEVFTHIDYAARYWPTADLGPFDPREFEDGFRQAMRAIADSGRALEMNTRRLWPWVPQWWKQEGGRAVSFGSDAHRPDALAAHFPEATAMLEAVGFRPGRRPEDFWTC